MKLDPSNTLVAAVQGNAWLLLLPAGFLCLTQPLLPGWRAHEDRSGDRLRIPEH